MRRHGGADWERALGDEAEAVKDRNLPSALKGRNPEAIALLRPLQALEIYDETTVEGKVDHEPGAQDLVGS